VDCLNTQLVLIGDLLSSPKFTLPLLIAKSLLNDREKLTHDLSSSDSFKKLALPQDRNALREVLFIEFAEAYHTSFFQDKNYALKDIWAIETLLSQNTGPLTPQEKLALLEILKQKPRPLERVWPMIRGQLYHFVNDFFDEPQ
jgi:hypothetical protein